jgi:hypothetical protein
MNKQNLFTAFIFLLTSIPALCAPLKKSDLTDDSLKNHAHSTRIKRNYSAALATLFLAYTVNEAKNFLDARQHGNATVAFLKSAAFALLSFTLMDEAWHKHKEASSWEKRAQLFSSICRV